MATKFYAVKVGRVPGIYMTWEECKSQVDGVKAIYKSFGSKELAAEWIKTGSVAALAPTVGLVFDGGTSTMLSRVCDLATKKMVYSQVPSWHGKPLVTNNDLELFALGVACKLSLVDGIIYGDSQYAIDCALKYSRVTKELHNEFMQKIKSYVFEKNLTIIKWDKSKLGENPADCK